MSHNRTCTNCGQRGHQLNNCPEAWHVATPERRRFLAQRIAVQSGFDSLEDLRAAVSRRLGGLAAHVYALCLVRDEHHAPEVMVPSYSRPSNFSWNAPHVHRYRTPFDQGEAR